MNAIDASPTRPARPLEEEIVNHLPALLTLARALIRNDQDALDLVQETCAKALARADSYRPGTNARAWLSTILRNTFIDGWCRESRRRVVMPVDEDVIADPAPQEPAAWERVDPARLWDLVATLPEPMRGALTLHTVDRLSYRQIAALQGVESATVGTRIARAKDRLRKVLNPGGPMLA